MSINEISAIVFVCLAAAVVLIAKASSVLSLEDKPRTPALPSYPVSLCSKLGEMGWSVDQGASRPERAIGAWAGGTLSFGCAASVYRFRFCQSLPLANREPWSTLLGPHEMAAAVAMLTKKAGKVPWAGGRTRCEFNADQIVVEGELSWPLPSADDLAGGLSALVDVTQLERQVRDFLAPAVERIDTADTDWLRAELLFALHVSDNAQAEIVDSLVRAMDICDTRWRPVLLESRVVAVMEKNVCIRGADSADPRLRFRILDWLRRNLGATNVAIPVREAAFALAGTLVSEHNPFQACLVDEGRQLWRACSPRSRDAAMAVILELLLPDQQNERDGRAALEALVRNTKAEPERRRAAFLILAGLLFPSPGPIAEHPLVAYAWTGAQRELQEAAFQVIERFGDHATLINLIPTLDHLDPCIWERLLRLVQDNHIVAAESHVLELLRSRHPHLRRLAVETLGEIGSASSVEPIRACMDDGTLIKIARPALGKLHKRLGLPPVAEDAESGGRLSLADGNGRLSLADDDGHLSVADEERG